MRLLQYLVINNFKIVLSSGDQVENIRINFDAITECKKFLL